MEEEKKKKSNWWIWVLIIILVILTVLVGGIYLIWRMIGSGINEVINGNNNIQNEQQWQKNIDDLEKQVNNAFGEGEKKEDRSVKDEKIGNQIKKIDSDMSSVSPDDYNQQTLSDKEVGLE